MGRTVLLKYLKS